MDRSYVRGVSVPHRTEGRRQESRHRHPSNSGTRREHSSNRQYQRQDFTMPHLSNRLFTPGSSAYSLTLPTGLFYYPPACIRYPHSTCPSIERHARYRDLLRWKSCVPSRKFFSPRGKFSPMTEPSLVDLAIEQPMPYSSCACYLVHLIRLMPCTSFLNRPHVHT
jgi:hypothetical protein